MIRTIQSLFGRLDSHDGTAQQLQRQINFSRDTRSVDIMWSWQNPQSRHDLCKSTNGIEAIVSTERCLLLSTVIPLDRLTMLSDAFQSHRQWSGLSRYFTCIFLDRADQGYVILAVTIRQGSCAAYGECRDYNAFPTSARSL